ncbi:MAG: DUF4313 domain-containing protein [Clostridiales bacterium]|nr:DUF4313 domain-containing protein [Clostridiales bacterium]
MTQNFEKLKERSIPMAYPGVTYQVFLDINSYAFGGGLYIGLNRVTEDRFVESVADLTVNLPGGYYLEKNEAYISHDFSKEKLAFIKDNGLGEPTGTVVHRGYADFPKVAFDLDRLKELDPEGFARWEKNY